MKVLYDAIERAEAARKQWENVEAEAQKLFDSRPNKIKLNVSGQPIAISKSTVAKWKGSLLYCLVATNEFEPDSDGSFFLDRDPVYVNAVMDYLRGFDDDVDTKELDAELLAEEMKFFVVNQTSKCCSCCEHWTPI